jgi:uncharacterized tellurite resistance protein B-like protein
VFLLRLTKAQQEAFLSLAHELVTADGSAAMGEVAALSRLSSEVDLDPDVPFERLVVEEAALRFDKHSSRAIVLLELFALAYADRTTSVVEDAVIRRLAVLWKLDSEHLECYESWALRHRKLVDEGLRMIAEAQGRRDTS